MTLFSSGAHDRLTADPKPWTARDWIDSEGEHRYRLSADRAWRVYDAEFTPRPEFDRPPTNPANPILAAYRADRDNGPVGCVIRDDRSGPFGRHPSRLEHWLIQIESAEHDPVLTVVGLGVEATPAQIIHARRVLTRLANLTTTKEH